MLNPLEGSYELMGLRTTQILTLLAVAVLIAPKPSMAGPKRQTGGTIALVNVRVVNMNPDDRKTVRKKQTVIVEDGLITKIGKAKRVEVPF